MNILPPLKKWLDYFQLQYWSIELSILICLWQPRKKSKKRFLAAGSDNISLEMLQYCNPFIDPYANQLMDSGDKTKYYGSSSEAVEFIE